jgi:hypothetical protein
MKTGLILAVWTTLALLVGCHDPRGSATAPVLYYEAPEITVTACRPERAPAGVRLARADLRSKAACAQR